MDNSFMENILYKNPEINEHLVESFFSFDEIKAIDSSFTDTNPLTYIIYYHKNSHLMSEHDKNITLKVIDRLKQNSQTIMQFFLSKLEYRINV
jgi:hypothetical protein